MFRGVKRESSFTPYTKRTASETDDLQPQWEMKAQISESPLLPSLTADDLKQRFSIIIEYNRK